MGLVFGALWGSFWVKVTGAIFLGVVAVWGWGKLQYHVGYAVAEAVVGKEVETKSLKATAKGATIRADPEVGKRGGRNPYLRAD